MCAELQATVKLTFIGGTMLTRRGVGERLIYGTYFATNPVLSFLHSGQIRNQLPTEPEPHRCMKISKNGGDEADSEN
jgi:hypothetical protein